MFRENNLLNIIWHVLVTANMYISDILVYIFFFFTFLHENQWGLFLRVWYFMKFLLYSIVCLFRYSRGFE